MSQNIIKSQANIVNHLQTSPRIKVLGRKQSVLIRNVLDAGEMGSNKDLPGSSMHECKKGSPIGSGSTESLLVDKSLKIL